MLTGISGKRFRGNLNSVIDNLFYFIYLLGIYVGQQILVQNQGVGLPSRGNILHDYFVK